MSDASQEKINFLARSEWSNGRSWESILETLRASGATPMQCIQALRAEGHMSLSAAKDLLNNSAAWADHRQTFESIQESLGKALKDTEE